MEGVRAGELLFSTAMTVRARALVARAVSAAANGNGCAPHWDESMAKQRLDEMVRLMAASGGDSSKGLAERLCSLG